ncbi:MAG: hypothetical protein KDB27_21130 [Planctomycetales bacterium]|nr:hypothetical protein [Planctomycetales bacterium]
MNPTYALPHLDVKAILAERGEIAIIWSIDDVLAVRPDLSHKQAWEVLKYVKHYHDAEIGISWTGLGLAVIDLYGQPAI